jgi:hypothetical protein
MKIAAAEKPITACKKVPAEFTLPVSVGTFLLFIVV